MRVHRSRLAHAHAHRHLERSQNKTLNTICVLLHQLGHMYCLHYLEAKQNKHVHKKKPEHCAQTNLLVSIIHWGTTRCAGRCNSCGSCRVANVAPKSRHELHIRNVQKQHSLRSAMLSQKEHHGSMLSSPSTAIKHMRRKRCTRSGNTGRNTDRRCATPHARNTISAVSNERKPSPS